MLNNQDRLITKAFVLDPETKFCLVNSVGTWKAQTTQICDSDYVHLPIKFIPLASSGHFHQAPA